MLPRSRLAPLVLVFLGCACVTGSGRGAEPERAAADAPPIEHGAALPFWGTWTGPELRLSFAGPWVLVEPAQASPGAAPIELRVEVLRREGEAAFALETSVAGLAPADFLRPTDWVLLVEADALALAMGDEALQSYAAAGDAAERAPALVGPSLLHELPLPEELPFAELTACLELAATTCAALEGPAPAPRAAGCREAMWSRCAGHGLDPHAGSSVGGDLLALGLAHTGLRYAAGLERHGPAEGPARAAIEALVGRASARATQACAEVRARILDGELDDTEDPERAAKQARLRALTQVEAARSQLGSSPD